MRWRGPRSPLHLSVGAASLSSCSHRSTRGRVRPCASGCALGDVSVAGSADAVSACAGSSRGHFGELPCDGPSAHKADHVSTAGEGDSV